MIKKKSHPIQNKQSNQTAQKTHPQQLIAQQWSGPLPPPAALEHFNQIIPNGAERIIALVEREQENRFKYEADVLDAQKNDTKRGHYLGAFISALAIAGAIYGIHVGAHHLAILALVSLPVMAIVRAILQSKSKS